MSDTKPGKTLTLKKKPAAAAPDAEQKRPKRAGARARQVAQLEREREKKQPTPAALPVAAPAPAREADERVREAQPRRNRERSPRAPARAEIFRVFAPCPHGLEDALAAEMQALGFDDAPRTGRDASFTLTGPAFCGPIFIPGWLRAYW